MSFASTYVPLYALAMGATAAEIGLLSSAASLGVIGGSALSGRLVRLLGSPKRVVVYCARIWEAVAYLPLLAIPFFFTGTTAVRVLIVVYAVRTLIGEAGVPAWAAFVPGLVPIHIRGRFMSLRSVLKMVAMMIIIPLAGGRDHRAGRLSDRVSGRFRGHDGVGAGNRLVFQSDSGARIDT